MHIRVLTSPQFKNLNELNEAVECLNGIGSAFELSIVNVEWLTKFDDQKWINPSDLVSESQRQLERGPAFLLVENRLKGDLFSAYRSDLYIITTTDWEKTPSLTTYLLYMFGCGLPDLASGLSQEISEQLAHQPDIGCISDFCGDKATIAYSMMEGRFCDDCRKVFSEAGLKKHQLDFVIQIIGTVKTAMMPHRQRYKHLNRKSELRRRQVDFEDQFTERKPKGVSSEDICKTLVAFANSLLGEQEGILFIGVSDRGHVLGVDETDKLQKQIRKLAESTCYPPIPIQTEVLTESEIPFIVVRVTASKQKPHFAGPAYVRVGSESKKASAEMFEDLITSRNEKARQMLVYRDNGTTVLIELFSRSDATYERFQCKVIDCTTHYATFRDESHGRMHSISLEQMRIKLERRSTNH